MSDEVFHTIDKLETAHPELFGIIPGRRPAWQEYVEEAFRHGGYFVLNQSLLESSIRSDVDDDGVLVTFKQDVYGVPTDKTCVIIRGVCDMGLMYGDKCKGIRIWDTDALLKASQACDECGKSVRHFRDLHRHLFHGLVCDECLDRLQAVESKRARLLGTGIEA